MAERSSSGSPSSQVGRPYRPVGSLERGLKLLEALVDLGWGSPAELARYTGIDRSSVYRLLNTLVSAGYAVRRADDGRYSLPPKPSHLAFRISADDLEVKVAQEELDQLVGRIGWPSDYANLVGGQLTILASSHRLTTMTFYRRLVGERRPLVRSALGRALLAAMSADQLAQTLAVVEQIGGPDADEVRERRALLQILDEVRARGYGFSPGLIDSNVSAIALPLLRQQRPIGAVNIVFFSSVMSPEKAARDLLGPLKDSIRRIEQRIERA